MAAGHALVIWCRGGVPQQSAVTLLLRLSRAWMVFWFGRRLSNCFFQWSLALLVQILADLRAQNKSAVPRAVLATRRNKSTPGRHRHRMRLLSGLVLIFPDGLISIAERHRQWHARGVTWCMVRRR